MADKEKEKVKDSFWNFARSAPWRVKVKLATVLVVGLGATSFSSVVIWKILNPRSAEVTRELALNKAKATPEPKPKENDFQFEYDLKKISMPLTDRKGSRTGTAQFSVALDLPNDQSLHWIQLNRAKLLTITFDVGSHFTFEDLEASGGLEVFKSQLKDAYQEAFGKYSPRQVALREWVTN